MMIKKYCFMGSMLFCFSATGLFATTGAIDASGDSGSNELMEYFFPTPLSDPATALTAAAIIIHVAQNVQGASPEQQQGQTETWSQWTERKKGEVLITAQTATDEVEKVGEAVGTVIKGAANAIKEKGARIFNNLFGKKSNQ